MNVAQKVSLVFFFLVFALGALSAFAGSTSDRPIGLTLLTIAPVGAVVAVLIFKPTRR